MKKEINPAPPRCGIKLSREDILGKVLVKFFQNYKAENFSMGLTQVLDCSNVVVIRNHAGNVQAVYQVKKSGYIDEIK